MKKILAVLIAALMICLSVVPAMAVFPVGDALYFVGQCIELYNTSAQIHEAYADTIQKAMDYRMIITPKPVGKSRGVKPLLSLPMVSGRKNRL